MTAAESVCGARKIMHFNKRDIGMRRTKRDEYFTSTKEKNDGFQNEAAAVAWTAASP